MRFKSTLLRVNCTQKADCVIFMEETGSFSERRLHLPKPWALMASRKPCDPQGWWIPVLPEIIRSQRHRF